MDDPEDYFHAEDFRIGDTIGLAGRDVLVYDCDAATKRFFKKYLDRGEAAITFHEVRQP